jgi:3-oxoadipate enol-lactonase
MAIMIVAGEAFNVLVEGDETKPALIVSDPLATNLHLWDHNIPALLEHFRIVRYDSRGHGESVADKGPYSIEKLGRDALSILDALGIEKAHWLGLSKGGMVGLWILAHAPGRIKRAVLANTAAQVPGPDLWNSRIRAARATGMEAMAGTIAERWFTKGFRDSQAAEVERVLAMVRATPLDGYIATCAALRDMDLREAIRKIEVPVLVIVGRHDPSTPPEKGAAIASAIPGARLVTLEASHMSVVEDPENFSRAVIDFLTAAEPAEKTLGPQVTTGRF